MPKDAFPFQGNNSNLITWIHSKEWVIDQGGLIKWIRLLIWTRIFLPNTVSLSSVCDLSSNIHFLPYRSWLCEPSQDRSDVRWGCEWNWGYFRWSHQWQCSFSGLIELWKVIIKQMASHSKACHRCWGLHWIAGAVLGCSSASPSVLTHTVMRALDM